MNALRRAANHNGPTAAVLLAAALPALLGSVLLMRREGLGTGLPIQQVAAFIIAAVVGWTADSWVPRRGVPSKATLAWLLAISLFIPIVATDGDGPRRWLGAGPVRLYLAPMVLPSLLLTTFSSGWAGASLVIAVIALWAQPDAAQASALALAALAFALTAPNGRVASAVVTTILTGLALMTWQRPDPLAGVPHVEGVLRLAFQSGWLVGSAAVAAALLPSVVLARVGSQRRDGRWLAVACYYAVLVALAPLEVTPVPILGFGASPILGYVAVAVIARRR
ncbi:MAG TPA: hypothetical protein VMF13_05950 [Luteitalea sp.]|nr:hypothetical protein [Luteitalea sp.]